MKILPQDIWIGLTKNNGSGSYEWTDGTEFNSDDYEEWGPGQPDIIEPVS